MRSLGDSEIKESRFLVTNGSLPKQSWIMAVLRVLTGCFCVIAFPGCGKQSAGSASMWPTIKPGEAVTINHSAYILTQPKRWDVVVFNGPTQFLRSNMTSAKRVIALPGETVSLESTGIVVNGAGLSMPPALSNVVYCPPEKTPQKETLIRFPYAVPARHYFVVGIIGQIRWTAGITEPFASQISLGE